VPVEEPSTASKADIASHLADVRFTRRYLHALVGRKLLLQPAGDLLRRPLQREVLRNAPT